MVRYYFLILSFVCCFFFGLQADQLSLKDNLQRAIPGDFLVIAANKTITFLHIYEKHNGILIVEEIAVPDGRKPSKMSWREWMQQEAPGNTSWVMYEIDLATGKMLRYYSFTKKGWFEIAEADNFLSKMLNLRLSPLPDKDRKKVGTRIFASDDSRFWQPTLVMEGNIVRGVKFDAWRTRWPKDNSELSGKVIELYLPQDNQMYPSYFPYWLQINGVVGKARVRIIDSGANLNSPKPNVMKQF
jgi:hypothetical protein